MRRDPVHFRLVEAMLGVALLAVGLAAARSASWRGWVTGLGAVVFGLTAHRVSAVGHAGRAVSSAGWAWIGVDSALCAGTLAATAACGGVAVAMSLGVLLVTTLASLEVTTGRSLLNGPIGIGGRLVAAGCGLATVGVTARVLGRALWPAADGGGA
jgi:hypothetical protein